MTPFIKVPEILGARARIWQAVPLHIEMFHYERIIASSNVSHSTTRETKETMLGVPSYVANVKGPPTRNHSGFCSVPARLVIPNSWELA